MGFWAWFGIWCSLATIALASFAFIGYGLYVKGETVFHQLKRLANQVQPLQSAIAEQGKVERPAESMLQPSAAISSRRALLKRRAQKASDRQRRLIGRLKDIEIDESRFS